MSPATPRNKGGEGWLRRRNATRPAESASQALLCHQEEGFLVRSTSWSRSPRAGLLREGRMEGWNDLALPGKDPCAPLVPSDRVVCFRQKPNGEGAAPQMRRLRACGCATVCVDHFVNTAAGSEPLVAWLPRTVCETCSKTTRATVNDVSRWSSKSRHVLCASVQAINSLRRSLKMGCAWGCAGALPCAYSHAREWGPLGPH